MSQHGEFVVKGGNSRNFRFSGNLLSVSSSRRPNAQRWVDFALYKSDGGTYVLSRAGYSLLYHTIDCDVVKRNNLRIGPIPPGGIPCELCTPSPEDGVSCPELPRHWAAMFEGADGVVSALERDGGTGRYMTNVAARLVEAAALEDPGLAEAWLSTRID